MTLQIPLPSWSHAPSIVLNPCRGSLSSEGCRRDCFAECVAHFDAWGTGESEYGDRSEAYSPYPNALLASIPLIPDTILLERWENSQARGMNPPTQSVVLAFAPGLLRDDKGTTSDAWVVFRSDDSLADLSVHLTTDEEAARSLFAAAVAELCD